MKGRKMSFQRIFLPLIFLPGFQSDRSKAFFNLIIQVEIFCNSQTAKFASTIYREQRPRRARLNESLTAATA